MPLSEHEQKLLDQMEQALYAEDPRFASSMKGRRGSTNRRRAIVGVGFAVVGLAFVLAGVTTEIIALGVVGFVVMVAGVAWAATPSRAKRGQPAAADNPAAAVPGSNPGSRAAHPGGRGAKPVSKTRGQQPKSSGTFLQRMEQRWAKRRDEGQRF
ncbi:MAG: DUF3040 domain-containing protein [Micrococcales bacterium]|nr:DUF3040 domain-containing protein [Micrococcales bacterium]